MKITFLGAARTVTGSKFLLDTGSRRVLFDCGLFQGLKELRLRNWADFPIDPAAIDAVVLTHAHLDHSGYLPVLVRNGFNGPVWCTPATADLCAILLPDSGHIQEEEAERANRKGYTKHRPARPLYDVADAQAALRRLRTVGYDEPFDLGDGMRARFDPAGHILGAAFITVTHGGRTIVFSGDLGRPGDPILYPPAVVREADYLLVESTYGDRDHADADPALAFARIVRETAARGGTVILPANAVGRAQLLMYYVHRMKQERAIPDLPLFLDSPMSADVTGLYRKHHAIHKLDPAECAAIFGAATITNSPEASKAIDRSSLPKIIISASGMATGGRVLHHLKRFAPEPHHTILFAGYQAVGTRGANMIGGAETVRIHGRDVTVAAGVTALDGLSAHADYPEIMAWLGQFERKPMRTFVVHGEPDSAAALRGRIRKRLGWEVAIPAHAQTFNLG